MRKMSSRFLCSIAVTIIALTIGLSSSRAMAQSQEPWVIATYQIAFPEGDTKDFIDATSFRGIGLEGRWFVRPNLSAGVALDWNVFFKTTDKPIDIPHGTLSGEQDRTINAFPILATVHYYMGPDKMFYVGLGAGPYYMSQRWDVGLYAFSNTSWHFGFAPEIGVSHEMAPHIRAVLGLQYNHAFESENTKLEYWALKLGIAY
jgi:hypothetical protein